MQLNENNHLGNCCNIHPINYYKPHCNQLHNDKRCSRFVSRQACIRDLGYVPEGRNSSFVGLCYNKWIELCDSKGWNPYISKCANIIADRLKVPRDIRCNSDMNVIADNLGISTDEKYNHFHYTWRAQNVYSKKAHDAKSNKILLDLTNKDNMLNYSISSDQDSSNEDNRDSNDSNSEDNDYQYGKMFDIESEHHESDDSSNSGSNESISDDLNSDESISDVSIFNKSIFGDFNSNDMFINKNKNNKRDNTTNITNLNDLMNPNNIIRETNIYDSSNSDDSDEVVIISKKRQRDGDIQTSNKVSKT